MTATPNGWLLDPERLGQINAVAALIRFAPYNDDRNSKWFPNLVGDCQGKCGWAEAMLIWMGWPRPERWACDLPDGRRHAVLIVNVADVSGDTTQLVLDCRYTTPQVKDSLPYTDWCKVE